ncbi:MAG: hypothetical protein M3O61_11325 [Gemmatimonadota bacterium]|nr:hypothetical protein [Gemmatimonadota bacterium]
MAYVGNTESGVRESWIVNRLGASYFGISQQALESQIEDYEYGESRNEITPVRQDEDGRYYIVYSAPGGGRQNFYLDTAGYELKGDNIQIWHPDATSIEVKP